MPVKYGHKTESRIERAAHQDPLDVAFPRHQEGSSYDAIVVLPYTRVKRSRDAPSVYRMSHLTARGVLAGLELYQQGAARRFILPGEQRRPATSDLEQSFLVRRGVQREDIRNFPNRNGTLQQLEPVARLQRQGRLGKVVVVSFAFHVPRVCAYMRLLGMRGDVAEVEQTHVAFLRGRSPLARANREELLNLPQLRPIRRAEQGISRMLLAIDRPFGLWAPATRLSKLVAGPAITDIQRGRARVELARLEAARRAVHVVEAQLRRGLSWLRGCGPAATIMEDGPHEVRDVDPPAVGTRAVRQLPVYPRRVARDRRRVFRFFL